MCSCRESRSGRSSSGFHRRVIILRLQRPDRRGKRSPPERNLQQKLDRPVGQMSLEYADHSMIQ